MVFDVSWTPHLLLRAHEIDYKYHAHIRYTNLHPSDSIKHRYDTYHFYIRNLYLRLFARAEGIEPTTAVLETAVMPLN